MELLTKSPFVVSASSSSAAAAATTTRTRTTTSSSLATNESKIKEEKKKKKVVIKIESKKSNSYLGRQSAILQLQQRHSSHLPSALLRFGGSLKVQDLNAILRHYGHHQRWDDLAQLFEWMQQQNKTNAASYTSYIKYIGESLNPVKALDIYSNIPDGETKNNVYICNSILRCLVRNGKFDSSIKLFNQMKQEGLTPDVITYSTLLAGCIKVKDGYLKAKDLVREMGHNALQMDSVTFGTLLAVCASNDQLDEAEKYFSRMRDEGLSPNLYHYSSLLNAYSTSGDYKKADILIQDMKSAGLVPNKVILTTLLKVYVRGGFYEKSRALLAELKSQGYAEDEMPYCILMDGLAKTGHLDEARLLFNEVVNKNVKTDGYAHSIMLAAYCRSGLLGEAKQLAKDVEAKYGTYDLVVLNTMLSAYCRAGAMESVMQTLKKMDELSISPDYNTFQILIKYFCKEKLYLLAYRSLEDMYGKGHKPEEVLCSSLIFHLGKIKAHSEAFSVYNILRYSKRTMCKALHEKILHILISGKLLKDAYVVVKDHGRLISKSAVKKFAKQYMKLGNINLINEVIKVVNDSGYKIDQELFEMAISRYIAQPEKKELLVQLLQWMPGHNYVVDSSTRNLVLKNSHLFGRELTAEILSKHSVKSKALKLH